MVIKSSECEQFISLEEREKMSDAGEIQFISAPQTHIIDTTFQKQQPASKLVNRYLSTAAQYLNRTKSFHVPATNTNNHIRQSFPSKDVLIDNLVQSMENISPPTISNDLPMSTVQMNASTSPLNCNNNNNSINGNKSQGFVNTLRRSLRKNKERFYNKRATTMKSCHALNTYEQTANDQHNVQIKMSMTPTLLSRHQHLENTNGTFSRRNTMKDNIRSDQMRKRKEITVNFIA